MCTLYGVYIYLKLLRRVVRILLRRFRPPCGAGAGARTPQRPRLRSAPSAQREAATGLPKAPLGAHAIGAERVARGGDGSQRLPRLAQGHAAPSVPSAEREAAIRLAAGARACRARAIGAERAARGAAHRRWQSRRCPTVH